jgi:hypothetical protein
VLLFGNPFQLLVSELVGATEQSKSDFPKSAITNYVMTQFAKCFPGDNGTVVCQHFNGSWIVFPGNWKLVPEKQKSPEDSMSTSEIQEDSEDLTD